MKIQFRVSGVKRAGPGIEVTLAEISEYPGQAMHATIDLPDTETSKRTYYVGRRVVVEIKPTP